ncbi:MAG: sugar porter family MFS transporter [Candidatus Eremiobacteraeota bacterium]|nr:sugar porter family MFS transporter [Candidatus Eremiobacteraeota bacterium]
MNPAVPIRSHITYNRLLLTVAGLGGLLYGIDVGIIAGALPYLEATSGLNPSQLSFIVAAVLLGSVISSLVAGVFADWLGRKNMMVVSALMFVASIPTIALSGGFEPLFFGRLLQGLSAGLIGVVVPLYLAECLGASNRGKGTGIFQWLLTFGFVVAGLITLYFSYRLGAVIKLGNAAQIFLFKEHAWRNTFWVSLLPGLLFVTGSALVSESPRWLVRRGKNAAALAALLRSRTPEQADFELSAMQGVASAEGGRAVRGANTKGSLLRRKYVAPFILACIILTCNQLTGINSIIGYNTTILLQGGLSDYQAHIGSLLFSLVNFGVTVIGVLLVDRKGRKFLLSVGSAGIIVSLVGTGILFYRTQARQVDVRQAVQSMIRPNQSLSLSFNRATANHLLATVGKSTAGKAQSLEIIYSYGDFRSVTNLVRSNETALPLHISRSLPGNAVAAFFANPFGNLAASRNAALKIDAASISPVPSVTNGWIVAITLFLFMGFYAVGPGVCVWLALSELMPTRIRSNGMSVALFLNTGTSTVIAAVFLPMVGTYGYSTMFFAFAACTVAYFVTATFFLPETKGKTLEQIEQHFEGTAAPAIIAATQ